MLARLARTLPEEAGYSFEPKWDGFRCMAFVDRGTVDLRSRHGRPFSRYFPEIVEALGGLPVIDAVVDGELVIVVQGRFDFAALMGRLHPAASRVERLRREVPASYVAFDLLALDGADLTDAPFLDRRRKLEDVLRESASPLFITPITADRATAADWLDRFHGAGVDGVVAKHAELRYRPGARAMVKVKREQTLDCVVGGIRPSLDGQPLVASLLLGLYDELHRLHHIGVVAAFSRLQRAELYDMLRPLAVPIASHPWREGFLLEGGSVGRLAGSAGRWSPDMTFDWIPIEPALVAEVAYDQVDGYRLRHPARFRRWRPDREPESCTLDQIATSAEVMPHLLAL